MSKQSSLFASEFFHSTCCNLFRITTVKCFESCGFKFTEEDVQEVVSEASLKVVMNIDKYDASLSKSSWFSTIARNCACDYINKEQRWRERYQRFTAVDKDGDYYEQEYSDVDSCDFYETDTQMVSNEYISIIENELQSLGKEGATALSLKAQGYSNEEIRDVLGVSDGSCRVIISRARQKLKNNRKIQYIYSDVIGRNICAVE